VAEGEDLPVIVDIPNNGNAGSLFTDRRKTILTMSEHRELLRFAKNFDVR